MKKPISRVSRSLLVLVVTVIALPAIGCRSTRSGLAQLPGLAWAAPNDAETFGGWDEKGDPSLPVPSKSATPQLATKSGTTPLDSTSKYPASGGGKSARTETALSNVEVDYPDTGYPALEQPTPPPASSPQGYATHDHGVDPGQRPSADSRVTKSDEDQSQPNRGFYGDEYGRKYDEPGSSAESLTAPVNRYADDQPSDTHQHDEHDGGNPSTARSRYSSNDDLPTPGGIEGANDTQLTVSDAENGYDPYGGQTYDPSLEYGPVEDTYPSDLSSQPNGDTDRDKGLVGTAKNIGGGIRDDYQRSTEGFKGRIEDGAASLSDSSREFTQNMKEFAQQAGDHVERGASGLGRGIRGGFSRFSGGDTETDGLPNEPPIGSMTRSVEDFAPDASALTGPAGSLPSSDFKSNDQDAPLGSPRGRSSQPWRPGSTGTYPDGDLDQSRYPSSRAYGGVEPASYPSNIGSAPRLAPTRR